MVPFTRRSILRELSVVVGALVVLTALASAQRPVAPVAHPVAPVHVYAPPPIYRPPVIQAPIVRAPAIYAAPRNVFVPGAGRTIVLPPVRPIRPIRPFPPVIIVYTPPFFFGGFWPFNLCWWSSCDLFLPWTLGNLNISSPGPVNYVTQVYETPVYVYGYGSEMEELPELYLKDGTILDVTDYWVMDDQLHFKIREEAGAKPVEHSIPFEELDLQKSVDANTRRGFRFVLRNQPFEESLRDHPEGPPIIGVPPQH
jgi:hypothetical protein